MQGVCVCMALVLHFDLESMMSEGLKTPCQDCIDAYRSAWVDGLIVGHIDCLYELIVQDYIREAKKTEDAEKNNQH